MKKIFTLLFLVYLSKYGCAQDLSFLSIKEKRKLYFAAGPAFSFTPILNQKYFSKGLIIGGGLDLCNSRHADLRISLFYLELFADKTKYTKEFDSGNGIGRITARNINAIIISPEIKIKPLATKNSTPYLLAGINVLRGINDGQLSADSLSANQSIISTTGFRFMANLGLGYSINVKEKVSLFIESKYFIEFFENSSPGSPFYKYKEQEDLSYKFLSVQAGIIFNNIFKE